MRKTMIWILLSISFGLVACSTTYATATDGTATQTADHVQATPVPLPGGSAGVGFDDLGYSPDLKVVIVPAGRTGNLDLVDPKTLEITAISGFSEQDTFGGGHGEGTTSADAGQNFLFATDRTKQQIDVVDPATKAIVTSAPLAADPDYVRYVAETNEVWVTEPDKDQIEVFSLSDKQTLTQSALIEVAGGPESLVIDKTDQKAYTHLWAGKTVAIDIKNRTILATWDNGCGGSRGIALDEKHGFLFAGCSEGKAVVLDVHHDGKQLSNLRYGSGVDVISYNPTLAHLYLPAANSGMMAIIGVAKDGKLTLLGEAETAQGAHCVTADDLGNAWVCDPDHGQLLRFQDPFPASGK